MKKLHKIISFISAAAIAISAIAAIPENLTIAAEQNRTVSISDADDFLKFAEECRINSASKGLCAELKADINLSGKEFFGIPIFCGTFNGNGHKISGLSLRDSASEMGLFRYIERGAVVKDLAVSGSVSPSGSANMVGGIAGVNKGTITSCEFSGVVSGNDSVGGIAGKNEESGVITSCRSSAVISAESGVGGIAGMNLGVLLDCSNSGNINTVYADPEIDTENMGFDDLSVEGVIGKSDIGGIAGYSSGIIANCSNSGTIGYQHTGYNVGGIAGRQCGLLNACSNTGSIFGRKDVGGIAGQMEPYRSIEFSEDSAQRLDEEMKKLSECVDKLISDARASGDKLNSEVQKLTSQMNAAQNSADTITSRTEEIFGGYSDGINELLARADIALDGAVPALNALDEAIQLVGDFSDKCAEALDDVEKAGEYSGEAVKSAREAIDDIKKALSELETGLRDMGAALRGIQNSLGDTEEIKSSLINITNTLDKITDEARKLLDAAKRLNSAFKELSDWLGGSDWQALENSVSALSECLSDVLDALGEVSGAVSDISAAINSGELNKALSELNSASAALGRAAAKLAEAVGGTIPKPDDLNAAAEELKDAADALQKAAEHLNGAANPDEIEKGIDELEAAADKLQAALEKTSAEAGNLSSALESVTGSDIPKDTMDTAKEQLDIILNSLSAVSDNLSEINGEIRDILDNIDLSELSSAMGALADAADKTANAASAVKSSADSIDNAAKSLENALSSLTDASSKAGEAAEIMSKVSEKLSEAARQIEEITNTLSEKSEVKFPALDETFTSAADTLSDSMKAMISTLSRISGTANSEGGKLLDDVQEISGCLSRIAEIFRDTYKDLLSGSDEDEIFSEDISEIISESGENSDSSSRGKALECVNSGKVEGDVNVGGITGAMAIEFDLDPEDDISQSGNRSVNFSYNVMDIIERCENLGEITAKKNYCGGIVGRMDMGLVKNSRASGNITSTSGNYVGGIAGYSSAKLRECMSKVTLSGIACIGGIAGEGGIITDCLSISDITEFTEKIGALAGYVDFSKENTEISENFFVDRGVAGIDRVSYSGIAEPIAYDEFAKRAGEFADIVLEFTADGVSLGKITVPFGGSVKPEDIPEIPQKSGYFAKWEDFDFSRITFPRVLSAEYVQLLSSVSSENKNENGLPLLLADGSFDDKAKLLVETESSAVSAPDGAQLRIVTAEGAVPTALRFLKTGENPQLLQYVNGAWQSVPFTENGSYLIVNAPAFENGRAVYCVSCSAVNTTLVIVLALAGGIVIIAVIVIITAVKHKSRKKQKVMK